MKPHIRYMGAALLVHPSLAAWWCAGEGRVGIGRSPGFAYLDWKVRGMFARI